MLDNFPLFPRQGSTLAGDVDLLFFAALGVSIVFSILIAALVLGFAVRFRRRHAAEVGVEEHSPLALEIAWTAIPLVIVLIFFVWGAKVFFDASRPPSDAAEYFVTGKQWMWKVQHPEGNREINELHVPRGRPVKLTMTSEDVIHSFFVPAFRVKADVLPGRYTTLWFEATESGTHKLFCTEYCGAEHSLMIGHVVVMEPHEYEAWLAGGRPERSMLASGKELFAKYSCNTCHRPDSAARAPKLEGVAGREVELADGRRATADDNYLRQSILDPATKVVKGYEAIMPAYQGQIAEDELFELVLYVKSLGSEGKK